MSFLNGLHPKSNFLAMVYDEMVELIRSSDGGLVPVWSGVVGKKPPAWSWMSLEGQSEDR